VLAGCNQQLRSCFVFFAEFFRSIARAPISFGVALCLHYCALGQSEAGFFPLATPKKKVLQLVQRNLNFFKEKTPKSPRRKNS
jgi:hypothetical protein